MATASLSCASENNNQNDLSLLAFCLEAAAGVERSPSWESMRLPQTTDDFYEYLKIARKAEGKLAEVFKSYERPTYKLFMAHFADVKDALIDFKYQHEKRGVVESYLCSIFGQDEGDYSTDSLVDDFTDNLVDNYECYKELLGVPEAPPDIEYNENHNPIGYMCAGAEFDDLN
jgi:hypothetical protein